MRGCGQPFERTASLMTAIVGSLPPRLFAAAFIAGVAELLAACDPVTNSLACVAVKGANDSVNGEVRCPLMVASRTQSGPASPSAMRAIVPRTFDPSLLRIRLAGTNIPLNTTAGRLTVTLYQGPMPVASNVFTWSKSGTDLVAGDPSAVSKWLRDYPNSDGLDAKAILSFSASAGSTATVQTAIVYGGAVHASTSQSFQMPRPSGNAESNHS